MQPYTERRARALKAFAGGVAIVPSAQMHFRNSDSEYEFRQNSDFFYLTGFDEPDSVLVLTPQRGDARAVLFLRERDRAMEIWNGHRLGVERAVDHLEIDEAYPIAELAERLPELLLGADVIYYDLEDNDAMNRIVLAALTKSQSLVRRRGIAPTSIARASSPIHAMRAVKSAEEIATLKRAARITRLGHEAGMRATRPGAFEYEIEAAIEYEYRRNGAQSCSYESIVAGGDNATILHYCSNRAQLEDGTLLLVDSGCEVDYYASDVTRTWPVNGRFSPEQRTIYEIVLAAQAAASAQVRPGNSQRAFHDAAVRTITEGLIDIGLLQGGVDENIELERFRDFYMHGTGHWMGLDVHDAGRYRDENDDPVLLVPGMVTTVEPGLYVHRDLDCDPRFKGIGVRIEDDLVVTADGHDNLTASIPKRIEDIEAMVGDRALAS